MKPLEPPGKASPFPRARCANLGTIFDAQKNLAEVTQSERRKFTASLFPVPNTCRYARHRFDFHPPAGPRQDRL